MIIVSFPTKFTANTNIETSGPVTFIAELRPHSNYSTHLSLRFPRLFRRSIQGEVTWTDSRHLEFVVKIMLKGQVTFFDSYVVLPLDLICAAQTVISMALRICT